MSTKTTVLFAAACLFVIVQVSSAWEAKPCKGFKGKLDSFETKNCPNKTGDYCLFNVDDGIIWDVKFTSGVSYEDAWTGYRYLGITNEHDHCVLQPSFCPGKEGQDSAYHMEIPSRPFFPTVNKVGTLQLFTQANDKVDDEQDYIVCVEFPAKFEFL